MAVLAFLLGSMIGAVSGLAGWLGFGLAPLAALGLYLGLSLTIGFGLILLALHIQDPPAGKWAPDPAH